MAQVKLGSIHVRKDRPGMYEATYYVNGKRRRALAESREAVTSKISELMEEARREPETTADFDYNVSLQKYAIQWLKAIKQDVEPKTHESYTQILLGHVLPHLIQDRRLGDMRLKDLKRRHIKDLISKKRAANYANDSVRLVRSVLSSMLTAAQDDEIIEHNPALGLFGKNKATQIGKDQGILPMGRTEFQQFIQTAKSEKVFGVFLTLLGRAGLRPSEAIALTPEDIDFDNQVIHVEKAFASGRVRNSTKTGFKRSVNVSLHTLEMLKCHISRIREQFFAKGEPIPKMLFPNQHGNYLDKDNAKRAFHRICRNAKVHPRRMYDLRHTFASLLLANGAPITYVAAQLGHTRPTTTLRYYAKWLPQDGVSYAHVLDVNANEVREQIALYGMVA